MLAKRGIIALIVSAVACVGVWYLRASLETLGIPLSVWGIPVELWVFVTLAVLLAGLFAVHKWVSYKAGPKDATYDVAFAGFYDPSGPEGNFTRSGSSKSLEAEFLRTIRRALNEHRINSGVHIESATEKVDLPLRVVDYRPPRGFHAVRDFEGFEGLARKLASRCVGVVWGTVDKDGRVERFEISVHHSRYHGRRMAEDIFDQVRRVVDQKALPSSTVVRYLARALAALWGGNYCQMLNDLGRHVDSLSIASDSRRLLEGALEDLREDGGPEAVGVVESQKRSLLPSMLRQEAWCLLLDGLKIRALERLFEALKIDPLWPFQTRWSFADFYNNRYAFEAQGLTDKWGNLLAAEGDEEDAPKWAPHGERMSPRYEERALADVPAPNLPLFVGWIELALLEGENLERRIEEWFAELAEAYPENPFVLIYWGDALKLLAGPRDGWSSAPRLEKVDAAIGKYEAAYKLDPSLAVVAVRLHTLYIVTASLFRETDEWERRLQETAKWSERAIPFYEEHMPQALIRGAPDEE